LNGQAANEHTTYTAEYCDSINKLLFLIQVLKKSLPDVKCHIMYCVPMACDSTSYTTCWGGSGKGDRRQGNPAQTCMN
jgi:hypothetical protein